MRNRDSVQNERTEWKDLTSQPIPSVDGVTFQEYEGNLDSNLKALVERLKNKGYHAKLVRRRYIPKENGKVRPLGIPALEDNLVQLAAAQILLAIYEADFPPYSDGYRAN